MALKLQFLVKFVSGQLLLNKTITLNAAKSVLLLHATSESWLATKGRRAAESRLATKASWTAGSGLASKSRLCAERSSILLTKHFLNCFFKIINRFNSFLTVNFIKWWGPQIQLVNRGLFRTFTALRPVITYSVCYNSSLIGLVS